MLIDSFTDISLWSLIGITFSLQLIVGILVSGLHLTTGWAKPDTFVYNLLTCGLCMSWWTAVIFFTILAPLNQIIVVYPYLVLLLGSIASDFAGIYIDKLIQWIKFK